MKKLFSRDNSRCGKCGAYLAADDSFCRYCGTERGVGRYRPQDDIVECVYGPPPVDRLHRCESCGFEWTTNMMIDNQRFCPKCGSKAPVIREDELRF